MHSSPDPSRAQGAGTWPGGEAHMAPIDRPSGTPCIAYSSTSSTMFQNSSRSVFSCAAASILWRALSHPLLFHLARASHPGRAPAATQGRRRAARSPATLQVRDGSKDNDSKGVSQLPMRVPSTKLSSSICAPVCMPSCPSAFPHARLSHCASACLRVYTLSIYPPHLSVGPSYHLHVCLSPFPVAAGARRLAAGG
jgi:hypothetical protein